MDDEHSEAVRRIASVVRDLHSRGEPFRIFHGSTSSTRPPHGQRVVDISALRRVLRVDAAAAVAVVEPGVPMDELVDAASARGLVPPVVMEFPGITVGGGFAGSAGESSSFRHGYFDETVRAVELVLANGDVVEASDDVNPDLFRGAAGALGTLGIVTRLEVRLVPARRYVKVSYHSYSTVPEAVAAVRRETGLAHNDYVEAFVFSRTSAAVVTGHLTDDLPDKGRPQTFGRAKDPWFYLHARKRIRNGTPTPDYVPLRDYLFRHDRGAFWMGELAFKYFGLVPFNRLTRRAVNGLMDTRTLYRAGLGCGGRMTFRYLVHDLALPYTTVGNFIDYVADELDVWPLWLCPLRAAAAPTFHPCTTEPGGASPQPMLNVGVWGPAPSTKIDRFVRQNRDLEARLAELGGRKVLYSHAYYTEKEFWNIYDRDWYTRLRERYGATSLPTVYDKVTVDVVRERERKSLRDKVAVAWPFAGFLGVWSAIRK
ncbi:FAD binding domain-containing protein [Colletotrichum navitas]|uniref:Delta(24)-sterol reductase n=1 Tax=Colletotrichum navitas TaxID=681940 RepID=A0AAD8PNB2_9PEZI|nr:FAD binding domain-containing protein [Colletotrichum navitas]KAK1573331.1 FAD binding domain-containing protein [Colletotrichum navitas]